jgi:phytoene synthase
VGQDRARASSFLLAKRSERLTRESGTNFYHAFRLLPRVKRQALYALYAFCRVVDDCVDESDGEGEAGLTRWLEEVDRCYERCPTTELGRDLAAALARFPIPRTCFQEIVAGCRMDLTTTRYPTSADLERYCRRVASNVGLAAIEIFGYTDPAAREFAVQLGLALQLTNILRDIASDAARGRLYLPLEDLARFGVEEEELMQLASRNDGRRTEVAALLAFEVARARRHFARAQEALPVADRRAMISARVMGAIYREILETYARCGCPIGGPRVRLSSPRKAWIVLRLLAGSD